MRRKKSAIFLGSNKFIGKKARPVYAVHPRYGSEPRFTGLNPGLDRRTFWWLSKKDRIKGTAIAANVECQNATLPVDYYVDVRRKCVDCGADYIFYAEEQKYWYENLGFSIDAQCIRCVDCRKNQRFLKHLCRRYEQLIILPSLSEKDSFEFIEVVLRLVEAGVFGARVLERLRMVMNRLPEYANKFKQKRRLVEKQRNRLRDLENKLGLHRR